MATRSTTTFDFEDDVIQSKTPVLVDFWAPWCPPCRAIAPSLEEISNELEGKLQVIKVDIDQNPELAQRFGVRSIPTLKVFVDGKVAKEIVGAMPKQALQAQIAPFVKGE
ncbi:MULTISPECIES: thioredoxin [Pseudomonadota]|uniref:Thioredoxin n=2 Tax=Pseudomonadota TaxID=1224 RepID=Q0BE91_BURCM|nr:MULTISPECIES: thioredoxin [Pseudomonadota]HCH0556381.1 thioredoxin [Pseudomonas aeruginosa]ABI87532.1 thioredoxin [Burkholderia ambifaria AMMD]AJY21409.1 thioredoxin [Burkholderia ambifaria AMMD]MBR7929022.1 thioredoxin [Burkholderia ambifaria]MBS1004623.1 thioredoxin [Acetobacter thailandicus]